jgi:hypothetical protein
MFLDPASMPMRMPGLANKIADGSQLYNPGNKMNASHCPTSAGKSPGFSRPTALRHTAMLLAMSGSLMMPETSAAADLATWDFSGLSGESASAPASSTDSAVQAAGAITRGSGLTGASADAAISAKGWTTDSSPDAGDYYEFSVTPAAGQMLDIDTLHFSEARSGTGIATFELRSSLDGFASVIDAAVGIPDNESYRNHSISLGSAFESISGQVYFRIYGYAAEGPTGSWRLRNHSVKGGLVLEGTSTAASGALSVSVSPTSFSESAGNPAAIGTITRTGDLGSALIVTLGSSDTSEAAVPAAVEIPANESEASFDVTAVDDIIADGNVPVTISAAASGYTDGGMQITVEDDGDVPPLVINEVDCDTPGSDTAEFIELFNKSGEALALDGFVVVLFNGSAEGNPSYRTIDLSGHVISGNGFLVIGNTGVANMDISLPLGELRNGADAIAIYMAEAASIPNGTPVASVSGLLVDAVVYDTNEVDDEELIAVLTTGKPQVDEGTGASSEANSIARVPDGGAAFDTTLFVAQAPTPGATNSPMPAGYGAWSGTHVGNQSPDLDFDDDGIANGTEYFMGSDPAAFTANPALESGTITWPRDASAVIAAFRVEVSTNLIDWEDATLNHAAGLSITASEVTFTPSPAAGSLFVRLSVTP